MQPDYSTYSLEELHQALARINADEYPDRAKDIKDHIERISNGDTPSDHAQPEPTPLHIPDQYQEFSEGWQRIFSLIDKAGGVKKPHLKELTVLERIKSSVSLWAYLFGPLYYLFLGMWKKAITYTVIIVALILLIPVIADVIFSSPNFDVSKITFGIFWMILAKTDYYKLKVLKQDKWIG